MLLTDPVIHRPISNLPFITKVVEKVVVNTGDRSIGHGVPQGSVPGPILFTF